MSKRLFPDDLMFEQRLLKCAGFYTGKIDGKYGPLTMAAEDADWTAAQDCAAKYGEFDIRSEKNIWSLLPAMQVKARQIMRVGQNRANATGLTCVILSGTRTYAEQNALYAQGRTTKGPKVTNARGGQSNHGFGIAIDIGLFKGSKYLTGATAAEEKAYVDFAAAVKAAVTGIEWGGDWKTIVDQPHYQLATGLSLSQIRTAFEAGKPFT